MKLVEELALLGGEPVMRPPLPEADRAVFTHDDKQMIMQYLQSDKAKNSYFGREGLLKEAEEALAQYFGRRYCVLTNSGTDALYSAYVAVGVEPGDEVIAPVYTFYATVTPLFQIGAIPVLVDVDHRTGVVTGESIAQAITERTRAVVVTYQWGHPIDPDDVVAVVREHGLALIEDVSLGVGSSARGKRGGTFGDVAVLSLGTTKMLSGGQGGALLCDDVQIWERANLVGHFGPRCMEAVQSPELRCYAATGWGLNFRIHALSIPVILGRLRQLPDLIRRRRERYMLLSEYLARSKWFRPQYTAEWADRGSWHGYCATFTGTEIAPLRTVVHALRAEGLQVSAFGYHPLLHQFETFQSGRDPLGRKQFASFPWRQYRWGQFPNAEHIWKHSIAFPLFLDEPLEVVHQYGEACLKVDRNIHKLRGS